MFIINEYPCKIKDWGQYHYGPMLKAMQAFTQQRTEATGDEIWLVEHYPIYTLGQRQVEEDRFSSALIPVVHTDRGGRITYHGPGQLVVYPLINILRLGCDLRQMVTMLEQTVIQILKDYNVLAYSEKTAPGVYIKGKKVASLGLRIRKGYTYHGIALNVDMDLAPFQAIHPCGLQHIEMTQLVDWIGPVSVKTVASQFLHHFFQQCSAFYKKIESLP